MSAAGLATIFRNRARRPRRAGQGVSPHFVVEGIHAWSAQLAGKALSAQAEVKAITDTHAEMIKKAQRSETGFSDRTGVTRRSVTVSKGVTEQGYQASIGPGFPGKGQGPPVARFLVFGTVKMSPRWDLFGLSQPGIDSWQREMEKVARL